MKEFLREYVKPFGVAYLYFMGIVLTAGAAIGTVAGIIYLVSKVVG